MANLKLSLPYLAIFLILTGCTKPQPPKVTISPFIRCTDEIAFISATLEINAERKDISEYGLCWSETNLSPTVNDHKIIANAVDLFLCSSTLNGLKPFTQYYIRAYAISKNGIGYSQLAPFTTKESWLPVNSGTTSNLNSVHFPIAETGYACGANGTIIKTVDGGMTWSPQTSGTIKQLNAIYFNDALVGNAVGDGVILYTKDGGVNWQEPNNTHVGNLKCINYETQSDGFAGGDHVLYSTKVGGSGSQWTGGSANMDYIGIAFDYHMQYFMASNGDFTSIGWFGPTLTTKFNGTSGSVFNAFLYSSDGWFLAGDDGKLLGNHNSTSWQTIETNTHSNLYGFGINKYFYNGFLVGDAGTIFTTFDQGKTWIAMHSSFKSTLKSVVTTSSNTAFAVGNAGTILKYKY